jgi:hypothetical protein
MNYNNGKIYQIKDLTNNNIYIGSTTKDLKKRLSQHESMQRRHAINHNCHTTSANIILNNNNYVIELIENVIASNKQELLSKERHYILSLNCVNKNVPNRTREEKLMQDRQTFKRLYNQNRQEIINKCKIYNEINKERLKIYQKNYRLKNKII